MKTKTVLSILCLIFLSAACEKVTLENMSVGKYIKLLRSDSYNYQELPAFDPWDIPELLKYADNDQIVTRYPHNPVSSLIGEDPRLGVLVLWTIESIRLAPDEPLGRFPSAVPGFWNTKIQEPADINIVHPIASLAYKAWWRSDTDFEQLKSINPLENTDYSWR